MRRAIMLVAILTLAGCTMPGRAVPTATADTTTTAGYRRATDARLDQVRRAVEPLHTACAGGVVAECRAALDRQEAASAEADRLIRDTIPPQPCGAFWSGATGLAMNAETYRTRVREALATNDAATVAAADAAGYSAWSNGWAANARFLPTDPCK